jgi:hypothetical protein
MRRRWKFRKRAHRFHRPPHPLIISRAIYQKELLVQRKRRVMHSSFQHNLRLRRHFLCSQSVMLHSVNSIQISPRPVIYQRAPRVKKAPLRREYTERENDISLFLLRQSELFSFGAGMAEKAASRAPSHIFLLYGLFLFVTFVDDESRAHSFLLCHYTAKLQCKIKKQPLFKGLSKEISSTTLAARIV